MTRKAPSLNGKRFGRLIVLGIAFRNSQIMWNCLCDCGAKFVCSGGNLRRGTKSCGCWKIEIAGQHGKTHGESHTTKEYGVWCAMLARCENPNSTAYADYGGRGIKVCARWRSYENFLADMGRCPKICQIERKDNDGDYTPENCVWTTPDAQCRNRRSNILVPIGDETLVLLDAAKRVGLPYKTVHQRLNHGWTIDRALTEPVHYRGHWNV